MRLIDADELKKKLKLWAFNNVTTTSPTFNFVTEFDIDECSTVDVLEQIRAEIEDCKQYQFETYGIQRYFKIEDIRQIIDKYREDKTDAT